LGSLGLGHGLLGFGNFGTWDWGVGGLDSKIVDLGIVGLVFGFWIWGLGTVGLDFEFGDLGLGI
jgi:hypothetical protein